MAANNQSAEDFSCTISRLDHREKYLRQQLRESEKRLQQSALLFDHAKQQLDLDIQNLEESIQNSFPQVNLSNYKMVDPSKFQQLVNVRHFKEGEVNVRIVDGFVVVTAEHTERPDEHGFISRSFIRRYKLPEDVELDKVTSFLNKDSVLTIQAPRKKEVPSRLEGGRIVPIEMEQPRILEADQKQDVLEKNPSAKS